MKASDLMIGDLVLFSGEPKRVKSIVVSDNGVERIYVFGKSCQVSTINDYIQPIPLTPEILEKNGFKGEVYAILKLDEHSWLNYYYHEHRLRKYWSGIDEWQNHSEVKDLTFQCHCYYVHELQHALRLCGIEKNIII